MNFELILASAAITTGLLVLADKVIRNKYPSTLLAKIKIWEIYPAFSKITEYARTFFPVLIFVLILRSFVIEPFHIPSGSLEPSLLIGDYILVNKYAYGLRLPVLHNKILEIAGPKRGDIAVFRYPNDPSMDYIKRIIGLPGDHVRYDHKILYINGQMASQQLLNYTNNQDSAGEAWPVVVKKENLVGIEHNIYQRPDAVAKDDEWIVPAGHYFVMGDNRDDSSDSRYWGYVPEKNLAGKAVVIWFSWNSYFKNVRWQRIGKWIT